jgi:hypothetical protein
MTLFANRRLTVLVVAVIIAAASGAAAVALPELNHVTTSTATTTLPAGCVKPAGGFLIIASLRGFNDSIDHGVPANNWPIMDAKAGQNVTIVVCNADPSQAHGFQIDHYYDARLVSLAPGQVLRVSFIATQAGTFRVYCQILCSVHWAMQNGQLVVS